MVAKAVIMVIWHNILPFDINLLLICTWFLKNRVWKMDLDELDFWSTSNWNFAGYTGSKNLVRTRPKIKFIQIHFSNSIFQKSCTDQQGESFQFSLLYCSLEGNNLWIWRQLKTMHAPMYVSGMFKINYCFWNVAFRLTL